MPELTVRRSTAAPADRVWDLLMNADAFPEFMADVLRVDIEPAADGGRVSSWAVALEGAVLEWRQREHLDAAAHRLRFDQLDGDLSELSGTWAVDPTPDGGSAITLDLAFEIGIPLLAEVLEPVAVAGLRDGFQSILDALDQERAG